jgi:hypothetical protein
LSAVKHPSSRSAWFARLRRRAAWPCALLLAFVLVLGGVHATDLPLPPASAMAVDAAVDAHCAGHDAAPDKAMDGVQGGDCCGNACTCAFAHAMGPLPGAMARHAFEPACPVAATSLSFHAKATAPPLRPPIA